MIVPMDEALVVLCMDCGRVVAASMTMDYETTRTLNSLVRDNDSYVYRWMSPENARLNMGECACKEREGRVKSKVL